MMNKEETLLELYLDGYISEADFKEMLEKMKDE